MVKKENETDTNFAYRMKYLYVISSTDKEQKMYAKILSKINFF